MNIKIDLGRGAPKTLRYFLNCEIMNLKHIMEIMKSHEVQYLSLYITVIICVIK